jgi:hypothetical protein
MARRRLRGGLSRELIGYLINIKMLALEISKTLMWSLWRRAGYVQP